MPIDHSNHARLSLVNKRITLYCCDTNSQVLFIERGILFVKERVRCARLILPTEIKQMPAWLMRELVVSTVKMINLIRRKEGVHPAMSPRQIVTGRKMVLPLYPPGSCVYAVKGGTTNSIDNMRTFATLYLRLNNEGGGHVVYYNINTMQRCSACRVIGINKKLIPITNHVIDTINKQTAEELQRIKSVNIDIRATINDYEERGNDSDSNFEYDDKLYETSDDSTVDGDKDLSGGPDQLEEDQQQHFNVPEVNDINEDDSNSENERMGNEGVGKEDDPIQHNEDTGSTVHKVEEEDGAEEDNKYGEVDDVSIETS